MNGNHLIGGGPVSPNPGPAWQAIGTGDFNGDGFSDILFQNTRSGQVSIWEMNGNNLIGGGPVSPILGRAGTRSGPAVPAPGSFDILFQNTNGQTSIWDMNGTPWSAAAPSAPMPARVGRRPGSSDPLQFRRLRFDPARKASAVSERSGSNSVATDEKATAKALASTRSITSEKRSRSVLPNGGANIARAWPRAGGRSCKALRRASRP